MAEKLTPKVVDRTPDATLGDVTDVDALLTELASLSPIDYDRRDAPVPQSSWACGLASSIPR